MPPTETEIVDEGDPKVCKTTQGISDSTVPSGSTGPSGLTGPSGSIYPSGSTGPSGSTCPPGSAAPSVQSPVQPEPTPADLTAQTSTFASPASTQPTPEDALSGTSSSLEAGGLTSSSFEGNKSDKLGSLLDKIVQSKMKSTSQNSRNKTTSPKSVQISSGTSLAFIRKSAEVKNKSPRASACFVASKSRPRPPAAKKAKPGKKLKVSKSVPVQSRGAHRGPGRLTKRSSDTGRDIKTALLDLQAIRTDGTWVQCSQSQCGKWRLLDQKDPSLVRRFWVCADNPDRRFRDCSTAEQDWDRGEEDKFVENRFTVGSLVWAKLAGWARWPAMVDDDPDTGDFFWTEVRDGFWEGRPSHYHVVFFDSQERGVTRAWVGERMLDKFGDENTDNLRLEKGRYEGRLRLALEAARKAGEMELVERRRQFCLANRLRGPWGPVWPGWGETRAQYKAVRWEEDIEEDDGDTDDSFNLNENQVNVEDEARRLMPSHISQEILSNMDNSNRNISLTNDGYLTDMLDGIESSKLDKGPLDLPTTPDQPVAKKSRPSPSLAKENIIPTVAQLYQDRYIFTHDMSGNGPTSSPNQSSFRYECEGNQLNSSSHTRTPIKRVELASGQTEVHSAMKTIRTPKSRLVLATQSIPPTTHNMTSTPVRPLVLALPMAGDSPVIPSASPFLEGRQDFNVTAGSEAFSADGSFMEL